MCPGWEANPNLEAAELVAYGFGFLGEVRQSVGQYPTDDPDIKVQNYVIPGGSQFFSVKFDDTKFPQ